MAALDLHLASVAERLRGSSEQLAAPDDAAPAAVTTLLREGADTAEVLLIERAERVGDPWSGHLAFPGGKREAGDRSLLETATRETLEEIGVALDPSACVARLRDVRARSNGYRVAQFVFVLDRTPAFAVSDEVNAVLWLPLARLADPQAHTTFEYRLPSGEAVELPCLLLEQRVLWGMTYRMAQQILEPLQQPHA